MNGTPNAKRLLLLLAAVNFMNFYDRQLLSALVEPIKEHFGFTDAQMGGLGSAFEITYPIAALLLGVLADRWARKRVIALGAAVWSVATMLMGAAGSYLTLALSRALLGVGCGGYGPAGLALLSDAYPEGQRGRAMAIHDSGLMVGAALGYVLGGWLGEVLGWRVPFLTAGVPGLLLALLAWRLKEPRRGASEAAVLRAEHTGSADNDWPDVSLGALRQLFAVRTLTAVYLANVLISFATGGLIFWLPSFLVRVHGLSLARAGLMAGVLQVAAGLLGVLAGGWLADKWVQRNPGGRMLTLAAGFLVGTPLAAAAVLSHSTVLFAVLASAAVVCYAVYFPSVGAQIMDVTRPGMRATATAASILLSHVLGHLPSSPFIGWLSDATGDLRLALLVVPAVAVLGGVVALLGARSAGADRAAMLANLQKS